MPALCRFPGQPALTLLVGATSAGALGAALAPPAAAAARPSSRVVVQRVIVEGAGSVAPATVAAEVRRARGTVLRPLDSVHGVLAQVSTADLPALRRAPGVRAVVADARVRFASVAPSLGYDAAGDTGSLYDVAREVGADRSWAAGYTGRGVDIALIDTGVSPVAGLTSGNVVNGPDLSVDSKDPLLAHVDGYGHGTHLAGIMVGREAAGPAAAYADPGRFTGIAPDARLLSIKVGAADGATDVSQVVAAIDWVSQHAHDRGWNIRVLNLSFGTDSTQSPLLDPLAYAAEAAWRRGLLVVVAGGNDGLTRTGLSDPAVDPHVLAVGGDDPAGTLDPADDVVPDFASHGTASRHVDVVAPAVHVISLRDPQSAIDQANPAAVVGSRFFRGSGTSQAAAVVSAAAALLLQRYPTMTNEQVKRQLMDTATALHAPTTYRGAGLIDVAAAEQAPVTKAAPGGTWIGSPSSAATWTANTWPANTWPAHTWPAHTWPATTWTGSAWGSAPWVALDWTGHSWTGHSWTGDSWTGHSWTGDSWTGHSWTGHSWTGHSWTSASWSGASWSGASWSGASWSGASWSSASWN